MDQNPEAQQPAFPQQHSPQEQGPPHYQPPQPPKKDEKKLLTIVIIVVIVIIILATTTAAILYSFVSDLGRTGFPTGTQVPYGTCTASITSSTSASVVFGNFHPEPAPVDIEIILVRNGSDEGRYFFWTSNDGRLGLTHGKDVGTLFYEDLADNEIINTGDTLEITDLYPQSDYELKMIFAWTGDQITSRRFSTPG